MSAFARSYAQAFLGAAPPGYDVDAFLSNANAFRRALSEQPPLRGFFAAPAIAVEPKRKALEELAGKAGLDEFGLRFFQLLLEKRRLLELAPILAALREEADRVSGIVLARVTVAAALADAERNQIAQALSHAVGRQVRLTTEIDEKILGGFVAQVGSEVFDASVRHEIEQFERQVNEGAQT